MDKIYICKLKRYLLDQPLELYVLKHTTWEGHKFLVIKTITLSDRSWENIGFRLLKGCASELRKSAGTIHFQIYTREKNEECLLKKMCFRVYMIGKCLLTKTRTAYDGYLLINLPCS